jgi:hypothetical protein
MVAKPCEVYAETRLCPGPPSSPCSSYIINYHWHCLILKYYYHYYDDCVDYGSYDDYHDYDDYDDFDDYDEYDSHDDDD